MGVARSFGTVAARAFVIVAALAVRQASIGAGAAIFVRIAIADARALDARRAFAITIGIAAALVVHARPVDTGLTAQATVIVTAGGAVVVRGSRMAALFPNQARGARFAGAGIVADDFTALVDVERILKAVVR